jgi:hypothetical protein
MTLHEAWWRWVKTRPAIAELLGERLYPNVLPDRVDLPAATYQRVGTDRERNLAGTSGLCRAVIELAIAAKTPEAGEQVADAVRQAIDGFQGDLGGVYAWEVSVEGQETGYDASLDRHFVVMSVVIDHAEMPSP